MAEQPAVSAAATQPASAPETAPVQDEPPPALQMSTSSIARELRPIVRGEVRDDPFTLTMYSTDASIYEIEPLVVVYPRDEDDVRACVWFAAKNRVPIIARGAGSGLTGESLGRAIILDLNVHMAGIIELDRQNETVAVEAGVVLDSLNRALKSYGYRVGPDPASSDRCTIGGMIANNSCGKKSLTFGAMRENLVSARVVLSDGSATNFRTIRRDGKDHERKKNEQGLAGQISRELPELLKRHEDAIVQAKEKVRAERNRSGYLLHRVNGIEHFHPQRILCGSEGTLGIVTECILKVYPLPKAVGGAAIAFESLEDAARAVPAIRETEPAACELFDAQIIRLAIEARPEHKDLFPPDTAAMLVVEYETVSAAEAEQKLRQLKERMDAGVKFTAMRLIPDAAELAALWSARKSATPLLFRRKDGLQPISIVEDACVPIDKLPEYVEKMRKVFEKHKLHFSAYAHAGHGEPHFKPLMDLTKKEHVDLLEKIAGECHAIVWACDGTISGEHGEGLARAQFIEKQAGEELYQAFKDVKDLFDPLGILNPNKKITADPHLMIKHLRLGADYRLSEGERPKPSHINPTQAANYRMFKAQTAVWPEMTVEGGTVPEKVHAHGVSMLHWTAGEMQDETSRCNGNGHCRSTGPEVAMCPRFKYNRLEDASPRAKANVLRRMLNGRQRAGAFGRPEVVEIMDYCFNCKRCVDECPSAVNIPKLAMEAKARYHMANAMSIDKRLFVNAEIFFRMGRAFAPIANTLNRMPLTKWLVEKIFGIDRRRELPRFKNWRLRHRLTYTPEGPRPKACLYLDLYPKYCNPELAQAAVDILEHHGYEVVVPDLPWTNMPALTHGAVVRARAQIRQITAGLAPYAFRGIPILTLEPTATLCLTQDYLDFVDTPETRAVARHTQELCQFLTGLHRRNKLRLNFQRVDARLAYLMPCHLKAQRLGAPALELLKLVPGVEVARLDEKVCCGMAGDFGMLKKHYDESMWIGRSLFRQAGDSLADYGCCESTGCGMQLAHGAGKPVVHPVQLLAAAYGFAKPKVEDYVFEPLDDHPKDHGHDEDEHEQDHSSHEERKEAAHAH